MAEGGQCGGVRGGGSVMAWGGEGVRWKRDGLGR